MINKKGRTNLAVFSMRHECNILSLQVLFMFGSALHIKFVYGLSLKLDIDLLHYEESFYSIQSILCSTGNIKGGCPRKADKPGGIFSGFVCGFTNLRNEKLSCTFGIIYAM
jgi:hypothetical protein